MGRWSRPPPDLVYVFTNGGTAVVFGITSPGYGFSGAVGLSQQCIVTPGGALVVHIVPAVAVSADPSNPGAGVSRNPGGGHTPGWLGVLVAPSP